MTNDSIINMYSHSDEPPPGVLVGGFSHQFNAQIQPGWHLVLAGLLQGNMSMFGIAKDCYQWNMSMFGIAKAKHDKRDHDQLSAPASGGLSTATALHSNLTSVRGVPR